MRNILILAAVLLCVSAFNVVAAPTTIDLTRESGEISGTVNYCGQSGSEGIEVSIPGKSFMARTDFQGKFTLSYVPEGVWTLVFIRNSQRLGTLSGIQSIKRDLTDLDLIHGPITLCSDLDGDGFTPDQDCNDSNPRVYPGAPELCGNGLDDNCNGFADESCPQCSDVDGDGFFAQIGCGIVDCNDVNPAINPGAAESCGDGLDNDCDGRVDEEDAFDAVTYYRDLDGDGYGDPFFTLTACNPPEGYSSVGGDCNEDAASSNPGQPERCNSIDDNCDELVDNNCSNQICTDVEVNDFENCMNTCLLNTFECVQSCVEVVSSSCASVIVSLGFCGDNAGCLDTIGDTSVDFATSICFYDNCPDEWEQVFGNFIPTECTDSETRACGSNVGTCVQGVETCVNGRWSGHCEGSVGPTPEICGDGEDNDCNSVIDDPGVYLPDLDNDGYTGNEIIDVCEPPAGYYPIGTLPDGDCDDSNSEVNPAAPESCDGIDNDCNIVIDDYCCGNGELDFGESCDSSGPHCLSNCQGCEAGWADCAPGIAGCETDLSDSQNCGACGVTCGLTESCIEGVCVSSCQPPEADSCGGYCTDLQIDDFNCGGCGVWCASGEGCFSGNCIPLCPSGTTMCEPGICVPAGQACP